MLLEAMASSAGVVASDLEPFHDLLQPGGAAPAGELFPRGDSRALAEATLRVLAAPNEARTTRARMASRRYDWAVIGPEILSIYGSVAGQHKVQPRGTTLPAGGITRPDGWFHDRRDPSCTMTSHAAEPEDGRPLRRGGGAIDASMDLLNEIMRHPVDPDYLIAAARPRRPHRRWPLTVVVIMIGAMLAVAALQATRSAPAVESERRELISRIQAGEAERDRLRARIDSLSVEITRIRSTALGTDASTKDSLDEIARLELAVGHPGDRPGGADHRRRRAKRQSRRTRSGPGHRSADVGERPVEGEAEAIDINGHRLSNLTAIRSAGDAITVDYRSLTRPCKSMPSVIRARWKPAL